MTEDAATERSNEERLALVLVELDDMAEALARARTEIERLRRAA